MATSLSGTAPAAMKRRAKARISVGVLAAVALYVLMFAAYRTLSVRQYIYLVRTPSARETFVYYDDSSILRRTLYWFFRPAAWLDGLLTGKEHMLMPPDDSWPVP